MSIEMDFFLLFFLRYVMFLFWDCTSVMLHKKKTVASELICKIGCKVKQKEVGENLRIEVQIIVHSKNPDTVFDTLEFS